MVLNLLACILLCVRADDEFFLVLRQSSDPKVAKAKGLRGLRGIQWKNGRQCLKCCCCKDRSTVIE